MRKPLVMGNWKMNGNRSDAKALATAILAGLNKGNSDIAVCVPFVYLADMQTQLQGTDLLLGAQNIGDQASGAYTGETSGIMLNDFDCTYVLVGHSERRSYYNDTNETVADRYCQALANNITPVLCIGETLVERQSDRTFAVVAEQLNAVIEKAGIASFAKAVIAYEPVWAIGTGKVATDEQAQEVHAYIRQLMASKAAEIAEGMQILYGGSVKPGNAESLFAMADIDGGLIGGAALDTDSFLSIYQATN